MSHMPQPPADSATQNARALIAPTKPLPPPNWQNDEIKKLSQQPVRWHWHGFVAADAVTLLTAPSKEGKSTLLALLLDRLREGGTLLGRPVRRGKTLVCSEDNQLLWGLRQQRLDFGSQVEFCTPECGVPSRGRWGRYIEHLIEVVAENCFDLVVVDPIVRFIPGVAGHSACLAKALDDLRLVANNYTGILLMHHPPRHRVRPGQMIHDSFLAAYADILIDMRKPPGDPFTRRRRFLSTGRYPDTPPRVLAELKAEGTDYVLLADEAPEQADDAAAAMETLCGVLREHPEPLTRDEILAHWPAAVAAPTANTLWRWLNRGVEMGVLARSGAGSKKEAFRYGVRL